MPFDPPAAGEADGGLLSPVSVGRQAVVSDHEVLSALVEAEIGLVAAYIAVGAADRSEIGAEAEELRGSVTDVHRIARAAVAGGNPVIPLVAELREVAGDRVRTWIHRGATSQDILDTALMLVSQRAADLLLVELDRVAVALETFAATHRDLVAPARTLTQHGVPTTIGLRAANWLRGVKRARTRLRDARDALPAQLGGAGGTLASFVEILGAQQAARMPGAYAAALGLAAPDAPWHTTRWPVTELGDALVQATDAVGVIAGDVATAARTEIGELAEATGGGSSAMPQKRNPARSVLIRSAAIRAPQLGATLHTAAALAVDERPDGAWHAEWPTLRELLRVALGAGSLAAELAEGLRVDADAVARTLSLTHGLIIAERLSIVLGPVIGKSRVTEIVAAAGAGEDLGALLEAVPEVRAAGIDVAALLDPGDYTGLAGALVDAVSASDDPADAASADTTGGAP